MQLHPGDAPLAMQYAVESLAAGFIGLDFETDPGNLTLASREALPGTQRDYIDFALRMDAGDKVLIIVHHFPFALCTVAGDYNYIRNPEPELGVWFRHFRRIDSSKTKYYADLVTNVRSWEQYKMTDAISVLEDPTSKSYKLIDTWS
jgi:hypothetical protein